MKSTPTPERKASISQLCDAESYIPTIVGCLDEKQAKQLRPHHMANFIALSAELFLTNYEGISTAFERNNGLEVTFKAKLAQEKDHVEISFKPVDTYKDSASANLPDEDQSEFDFKGRPTPPPTTTDGAVVVDAEEILALPAPIDALPAPDCDSMTADEQEAFNLGKSRFEPGLFCQDECTYGDAQNHLRPAFEKGWYAALRKWRIEKAASELLSRQVDPHELDVWESNCDDGEFPEILRLAIDKERGGKARKRTLQRLEAALAKVCPPSCLEECEDLTDREDDDTATEEE